MYECLFRNLPGHPEWAGSFHERLVEDGIWDEMEFWRLHLELVNATSVTRGSQFIERGLALAVARIHSRVLGAVAAHVDPNDLFRIPNLSDEELRTFIERWDHAVLGFFSGNVIPESSYDLHNPLQKP